MFALTIRQYLKGFRLQTTFRWIVWLLGACKSRWNLTVRIGWLTTNNRCFKCIEKLLSSEWKIADGNRTRKNYYKPNACSAYYKYEHDNNKKLSHSYLKLEGYFKLFVHFARYIYIQTEVDSCWHSMFSLFSVCQQIFQLCAHSIFGSIYIPLIRLGPSENSKCQNYNT